MSITRRVLLLVLLALAPAVAVQIYSEQSLRASREERVTSAALRYARAISADLTQFADAARQVVDILAAEPAIRNQDAEACTSFLGAVAPKITGANILVVTDASGAIICNSRGAAKGAYSLTDRDYFKRVMATGASSVGEYVIGRGTGLPTIQFAHPLRDAVGAVVGMINLGFDPEWLARRLVAQAALPTDSAVTVIDRSGTVLMRLPDHETWAGRQVPETYAIRAKKIAAQGGAGEMSGLRSVPRLTGVALPEGALEGVAVIIGISREYAFADIDAATRRGAILIVLGTLVAILAAFLFGRTVIRRPVRQLLEAATAWGDGKLAVRSGLYGNSEFGQLGRAFDRMAAALQGHENSLKAELTRSHALQEQQVTMLHELNHRVKNTLATVQSLARQSRGGEDQAAQLENRIIALSKTHDLLTRRDWTRASLRQVFENELGPYANGDDPFVLAGEDVELPPRYVLALGMTAHELTTNAAKYGALSREEGRVRVDWRVTRGTAGETRLRIDWQESEGPPVGVPTRRGFGTRLITGGIARELAGEVRLVFEPKGLHCLIDVPLDGNSAASSQVH